MGLFDAFKKKDEKQEITPETPEEERQRILAEKDERPQGKYKEACSACGGTGTDKKWMGQYWHVKCLRSARKQARGMV
jgi:hypothetical protein